MYLRRLEIESTGPIADLAIDFPFSDQRQPVPVVFVGRNGSGKSIALAHIVSAMIDARSAVYEDGDVEKGKVYKLRSPIYVTEGASYSRATVMFDGGLYQSEMQIRGRKQDYEGTYQSAPLHPLYKEMDAAATSIYKANFVEEVNAVRQALQHFTMLFMPPNRFEEPAWLNANNLRSAAKYSRTPSIQGLSGRRVIAQSPLADNQDWLLDVIYDAFALESKMAPGQLDSIPVQVFLGYAGSATSVRTSIELFLSILLEVDNKFKWILGRRGRRTISLHNHANSVVVNNLFALSTGQTALLNIFLTIVRDFDLSGANFTSLADIRGTVVIDEVDLHLHADLQYTVLPTLIALFPSVQFILTTHSPLFVLGLENSLGVEGVSIIELPSGHGIGSERFSEFLKAYQSFSETRAHEEALDQAVFDSQRPVLFVEGTIDIDYLRRAAELLGRGASLDPYRILDANGYGGLNKLWQHFDGPVAKLLQRKVTLLYDCDIKVQNREKEGVRRLVIPSQNRRITKGIENLLSEKVVERAMKAKSAFVDITPAHNKLVRGAEVAVNEVWIANVDEKRNLADWIIQNATADDFADFSSVFDMLDANPPQ